MRCGAVQAYRLLHAALHLPGGTDHDLTPLLRHLPAMDLSQVLSLLPLLESRNLFNAIVMVDSLRLLGTRGKREGAAASC